MIEFCVSFGRILYYNNLIYFINTFIKSKCIKTRKQKMSRPYLVTSPDGTKEWMINYNQLHRLDGPAVIMPDGTTEWFRNGKCHREDGPAIETPEGTKAWYLNGLLHREDGPAVIMSDGSTRWFKNGKYHREDGPAVEDSDGSIFWFYHGDFHRIGGHAFYCNARGEDRYAWYLYGVEMTEEKYNKVLRLCKIMIEKLKSVLRRKYMSTLIQSNICDEVNLYNIIAEYII